MGSFRRIRFLLVVLVWVEEEMDGLDLVVFLAATRLLFPLLAFIGLVALRLLLLLVAVVPFEIEVLGTGCFTLEFEDVVFLA